MSIQRTTIKRIVEFSNELRQKYSDILVSNYYNQYSVDSPIMFDYYKDDSSLCFGGYDNELYRLFFISADLDSLNRIIPLFPRNSIIEFIFVGDNCPYDFSKISCINQIDSFKRYHTFLSDDSFAKKLDHRFFSMYLPDCTQLADSSDFVNLQCLLNTVFDKRVSHLPSNDELKELINKKCVIVCKQNGEIKTFWILKKEGKRIYSYEAYNSIQGIYMQSLWYKYFNEFKEQKYREVYAWVSDKNFFSLNLHYKFNFTFDRMNLLIFETK